MDVWKITAATQELPIPFLRRQSTYAAPLRPQQEIWVKIEPPARNSLVVSSRSQELRSEEDYLSTRFQIGNG